MERSLNSIPNPIQSLNCYTAALKLYRKIKLNTHSQNAKGNNFQHYPSNNDIYDACKIMYNEVALFNVPFFNHLSVFFYFSNKSINVTFVFKLNHIEVLVLASSIPGLRHPGLYNPARTYLIFWFLNLKKKGCLSTQKLFERFLNVGTLFYIILEES